MREDFEMDRYLVNEKRTWKKKKKAKMKDSDEQLSA